MQAAFSLKCCRSEVSLVGGFRPSQSCTAELCRKSVTTLDLRNPNLGDPQQLQVLVLL